MHIGFIQISLFSRNFTYANSVYLLWKAMIVWLSYTFLFKLSISKYTVYYTYWMHYLNTNINL
jgi:hypothetical protein